MESNDNRSSGSSVFGVPMEEVMDFCGGFGDFLAEENRLPEETYSYLYPEYPHELDIRHPRLYEEIQKPENAPALADDAIAWILSLPQEEVAEDLSRIIMYEIGRTLKAMEKKRNLFDTIIHCLALLTQIGRPEGFEAAIEVARQNGDFIWAIDFQFGDTVNMILPHALYATGNGQTDILEEFLMHPGYETDHKGYVAQALAFIAMEMQDRRDEILGIFRRYISFMRKNIPEAHGCSGSVAGQVIRCLTDIKAIELLPEIKQLFDLGFVNRNKCGSYEKIESELTSDRPPRSRYDFTGIKDFYARVKAELHH